MPNSIHAQAGCFLPVYGGNYVSFFEAAGSRRSVMQHMGDGYCFERGIGRAKDRTARVGFPRLGEIGGRFEDQSLMRIVENHSEAAKDFAANGAVVTVAGRCSAMRGRERRDWFFDFEGATFQGGEM